MPWSPFGRLAGHVCRRLLALPPDLDTVARADGGAEQIHQVVGGPAVGHVVDGRLIDEVVMILGRLLLEVIHEHLQVRFRDAADLLVGRVVVQVDHRSRSSPAWLAVAPDCFLGCYRVARSRAINATCAIRITSTACRSTRLVSSTRGPQDTMPSSRALF